MVLNLGFPAVLGCVVGFFVSGFGGWFCVGLGWLTSVGFPVEFGVIVLVGVGVGFRGCSVVLSFLGCGCCWMLLCVALDWLNLWFGEFGCDVRAVLWVSGV